MEKLRNLRRKYFSPEMSMKALFAFCIIYAIVAGVALFKISNANASDEDNNMEGVLDFKTASEDFFNEYYQKTTERPRPKEGVLDFKTASEDFFNEYYQKTPNE